MATVTLNLPSDIAELLNTMPEAERNNFAVSLFSHAFADENDAESIAWWSGLSENQREMYREENRHGLAAIDAGRSSTKEAMLARIRAKAGTYTREKVDANNHS